MLGGYGPIDGTVEFYGRLHAFLQPRFIVADLGAGRGAWFAETDAAFRRDLRMLKGTVAEVIGLDLDEAVLANRSTDRNLVLRGPRLPLDDSSIDVVLADYVLEHVDDPVAFEREAFRVLRPGGLFCARTPHRWNYASIGSRLLGARLQAGALRVLQPGRDARDVFPTRYRCNTLRRLAAVWPAARWTDYSYLYTAEPSYHGGSTGLYRCWSLVHRFAPPPLVANIFVFKIKRPADAAAS
jgi:SAM-dependent methyltransferase